jgi:regulator of sirC expression with transglutaminase-like and TPR domain
VSDELLKHYLRAATPREIVARMLRNLEEVYTSHQDPERLILVKQRLAVLLPQVED